MPTIGRQASRKTMGSKAPTTTKVARWPRRAKSIGATLRPSASTAMRSPSSTPNTRDRTLLCTTLCSSVSPATSIRSLPTPATPTNTGARARIGNNPLATRAVPHETAPAIIAGVSRRATRRVANAAPVWSTSPWSPSARPGRRPRSWALPLRERQRSGP